MAAQHSGTVPSIEKALANVIQCRNEKAVADALKIYKKGMNSAGMTLPVDLEELERHHNNCMKMAVSHFHDKSVLDCEFTHQEICMTQLLVERKAWINKNREASLNKCFGRLGELFRPLKKRVHKGEFKRHGGIKELKIEAEELKERYMATPGLGDQTVNALDLFMKNDEEWLKQHPDVAEEEGERALILYSRNDHEVNQRYDSGDRQAIKDLVQMNKNAFYAKMEDTAKQTGMDTGPELSQQESKLWSFLDKFIVRPAGVVGNVVGKVAETVVSTVVGTVLFVATLPITLVLAAMEDSE